MSANQRLTIAILGAVLAGSPGTLGLQGDYELSTTADAEHVGPIGQYQGPSFSGVLRFSPANGDCLNSPATELEVNGQGLLLT